MKLPKFKLNVGDKVVANQFWEVVFKGENTVALRKPNTAEEINMSLEEFYALEGVIVEGKKILS